MRVSSSRRRRPRHGRRTRACDSQKEPRGACSIAASARFTTRSRSVGCAVGMPGCDLLVPLDLLEFGPAVAGKAEWALAIPNTPALAAAVFRQQAFVFDVNANPLGFAAVRGSNGTQ